MYSIPDVNSTVQLLQYENTVLLNGMLGIGILILVFTVLVVRMSAVKSKFSFAVSGFVTGVLSVLLYGVELINDYTLVICVVIAVISVIFLITADRD